MIVILEVFITKTSCQIHQIPLIQTNLSIYRQGPRKGHTEEKEVSDLSNL